MGFPAPKLTNAGKQIQLKSIAGKTLTVTKMKVGSGSSTNVDIATLTDLINVVHSFNIVSQSKKGDTVEITATFNSSEIQTTFEFREIGVFVRDPDTNQEVLYCYTNCGDVAEKIEATEEAFVEKTIRVPVAVGDAESIEVVIEPGVYVTQAEFQEEIAKLQVIPVIGSYEGSDVIKNSKLIPYTMSGTVIGYFNNYIRDLFTDTPKIVYIVSSSGDYYEFLYFGQANTKVISNTNTESDAQVYTQQDNSVLAYYVPNPSPEEMSESVGRKLLACEEGKTYTYMIIR